MSWVTAIWSMVATACVTLALIHGMVWWKRRGATENLLFAIMATATALLAAGELWMMRPGGTAGYAQAVRWSHVPACILVLSLVGFIRRYLSAGSLRLAWIICALRVLALVFDFTTGENLNFNHVSALRPIHFLGETVVIGTGERNPFMLVGQVALLLLMIFVVDATVTVWRRGARRQAVVVGGGIIVLSFLGGTQSTLALWGLIPLPVMVSLFYLGLVVAMAAELSRDILRSSELSSELQESEQRMSQAAAAANLGLWAWDVRKDEIWGTDRFRSMFGFGKNGSISLKDFLARVHPEDRDNLKRSISASTRREQAFEAEYRIMNDGEEIRWIAASGSMDQSSPGTASRMRGVCRDVTAARQSQQEAARLRVELAHAGRVSMMGQLASTLAHELNQPLGAILRNAEAAEIFLRSDRPDLDEIRAIIRDIREDDERAGAVIDGMRTMLQRVPLETEAVDLVEVMERVKALVRADAVSRHIKVDFLIEESLPEVAADRVHLQQVLLNLIFNGMDAVDSAKSTHRLVEVSADKGDDGVTISIRDHGLGIDLLHRDAIFQPFFTTKPGGMGMGLAISTTIVEAHGGRLVARTHETGGAVFSFQLLPMR